MTLLLAGCAAPPANRVLPQRSPDGRYAFDFDRGIPLIREGRRMALRDEAAPFRKGPDLYWLWDEADRLWLYRASDGAVGYYTRDAEGWRRHVWTGERSARPERDLLPPLGLYPPCPSRE